jgi:SAM-dependent methyltransferase
VYLDPFWKKEQYHFMDAPSGTFGVCGIPSNRDALTAQQKVTREWDGMAGEWDDLARGYANGFYRLLLKATTTATTANTGILDSDDMAKPQSVVVDFGCGTGLLTAQLRLLRGSKVVVVGIDPSRKMIELLQDKILGGEWENVQAVVAVLGDLASADESTRTLVEGFYGTVDLVVASSVLTFIPQQDMEATMKEIGKLLRPGGVFCHSDWPKSEGKHPDAMTNEMAERIYSMAGLRGESMEIKKMEGLEEIEVFFGVARKCR